MARLFLSCDTGDTGRTNSPISFIQTHPGRGGYQGIRSRYDVHTPTGRTFTIGLSTNH